MIRPMVGTPADHPPSCHRCAGTGFEPGEPIKSRANGQDFEYSTVRPCTHEWRADDPFTDADGYSTHEGGPPPWVARGVSLDEWLAHVRDGA